MANKKDWMRAAGAGLMGGLDQYNKNRAMALEEMRADNLNKIAQERNVMMGEDLEIKRQQMVINQAQEDRRLGQGDKRLDHDIYAGEAKVDQGWSSLDLTKAGQNMRDATTRYGIDARTALGEEGNRLHGVGIELRGRLGDEQNRIASEGNSIREALGIMGNTTQLYSIRERSKMAEEGFEVTREGYTVNKEIAKARNKTVERGQDRTATAAENALSAQISQWGEMNAQALDASQSEFVDKVQGQLDVLMEPGDMDQIQYTKQLEGILKNSSGEFDAEEINEAIAALDAQYMDKRLAQLDPDTDEYAMTKRESRAYVKKVVSILTSARKRGTNRFGFDFGNDIAGYLTLGDDAGFMQQPLKPVTTVPTQFDSTGLMNSHRLPDDEQNQGIVRDWWNNK